MKIPVNNIMAVWEFLNGFLAQTRPIPAAGVARFIAWHQKLLPYYVAANEQRGTIASRFAALSMDGKSYTIPEDKVDEFNAAWAPFGTKEVEITVKRIKVNDLFFNEAYIGGITQAELLILGPLVKG